MHASAFLTKICYTMNEMWWGRDCSIAEMDGRKWSLFFSSSWMRASPRTKYFAIPQPWNYMRYMFYPYTTRTYIYPPTQRERRRKTAAVDEKIVNLNITHSKNGFQLVRFVSTCMHIPHLFTHSVTTCARLSIGRTSNILVRLSRHGAGWLFRFSCLAEFILCKEEMLTRLV